MKNLTKKTILATALLTTIATNSLAQVYAYEAPADAQYNKEFKKGDFNPYWFQEEGAQMIVQNEINTKDTVKN